MFMPMLHVPAQAEKAPAAGREIAFPGFNAFPLKASVLPAADEGAASAGAHPYFAVMVAGSGPTDRNWASSVASLGHAGRDFALWLQARNIGSLRYDKRFIGSRDPKLDISLDAQVGDIQAALRAARALPEAKGRKLLLVGHSEGALLSLIAAKDADALLLLGLPGQSLAKTIRAQIEAQLPPDAKAVNLEFVDAMLDALRTGKSEAPAAKAGVHPGIANLPKSFMRPETAGFVRSTMDLEPMAMAERVAAPMAIVWGDKDVQAWRPGMLPESLKPKVIELKDANHLLRKETRPRAELNGSNALRAYNDSTPMADLSLLARWLESLR
ncbi:MAG: alpha/beta fold hydrolase [Holophagaceae bacterium]|nr:alpha/beta fold hydrolase [Holophagaceae bacterium]